MTWTGQNFTVGQQLSAAQMNNVQADITAVMDQDPGAPAPITDFISLSSQIAAGIISQSELKTTTSSQNLGAFSGGTGGSASPTGGNYSLMTFLTSNILYYPQWRILPGNNPSYATQIGYYRETGSGTATILMYSRYVQASPPYNMGDGDIPLFIYVLVEKGTGKILQHSIAPDPYWAYHGPTNIAASIIETTKLGNKQKARVPKWMLEGFDFQAEIKSGNSVRRDVALKRLQEDEIILIDADHAWKNRDMNIVPHPFVKADLSNAVVIMLDPVSSFMEECFGYHKATSLMPEVGTHLSNLLDNGYIKFGDTALNRKGPKGVMIVSAQWA